jgi:hypothetical protein
MAVSTYKNSAAESGKCNVNADILSCTLTGAEDADTTVLLRKMREYNTYLRMTVLCDSAMIGAIDVGYVSRDDDQADSLDAFGEGLDVATASASILAAPVAIDFKHDIALTIRTNNAANAGKQVKVLVEFMCDAG